jgi:hypothetical protein
MQSFGADQHDVDFVVQFVDHPGFDVDNHPRFHDEDARFDDRHSRHGLPVGRRHDRVTNFVAGISQACRVRILRARR